MIPMVMIPMVITYSCLYHVQIHNKHTTAHHIPCASPPPTPTPTPPTPLGSTLVSVSTIGTYPDLNDTQLINAVQEDLITWWGPAAAQWQHLKTYRIPFAQPNQAPPTDLVRPVALQGGVFVCGDHRDSATLDGVLCVGGWMGGGGGVEGWMMVCMCG